ncbi:MAG: aminopeptidase P family protein [Candidatus Taylorbacteria bacterium]|nr:aminopeptidase P family protein [Candidatus Taylorbacteria bacterium]
MKEHLLKIKKILREKDADAFWLANLEKSGQPGTQYLSGFTGSDSHLVVTKNNATLLTDGRYLKTAKIEVGEIEVIDVGKLTFGDFIKVNLSKKSLKKILIDGSLTSFSSVEKIKEKISDIEIINNNDLLKEIRRIKTQEEIKLLQKAAEISCLAFKKLLPFIKVGVSEIYLAKKLESLLFECGAEGLAFNPIIASGKNGALPHATPSEKKLEKGELVVIDFGASYKSYVSDMTRTIAVGKISPTLTKIYNSVLEAQESGCKIIRSGIQASDVDKVCRKILTKHDLEKYFIHSTGHGIGMEVHELPSISSNASSKLKTGEVITCEPGVYINDLGGVRIEDSLIVTKNGSLNLTNNVEKKLIVM